jgi:hypothetical protein
VIDRGRANGVETAQGSANQCSKWDNNVGLFEQGSHHTLDADISLDDRKIGVVTNVIQAGLLEHEVVQHRHFVARIKKIRDHG